LVDNELKPKSTTLLVFIDETGVEDFSDPRNPTFGRGGCAALGANYKQLLKRPWKRLKREKLGGASKPFHATEFEQSKPSQGQISAINNFLKRPFWRFATMCDTRTILPEGVDAHRAISLVTANFIRRLIENSSEISDVALVFEASERGDKLVQRDFDLATMTTFNRLGRPIEIDGYFMPKTSMEAGLEIADLIVHTAGRQRRHQLSGKTGTVKDFQQMYWHSPIPPAFMSIDSVALTELNFEQ
jgi:hypothetical protein